MRTPRATTPVDVRDARPRGWPHPPPWGFRRQRPLRGAIFDVENPMKVGGASPAGSHRERPLRWSPAVTASRIALHNDTLRTDFGGTAPSGPMRFAAVDGSAGRATPGGMPAGPFPPRFAAALRPEDLPASVRRHRQASRLVRAGAERVRALEGKQAHGRNGRRGAGNGVGLQRTRQRSKAVKSAVSSGWRWLRRPATGVAGGAASPAER
jgi:hypothetical protein